MGNLLKRFSKAAVALVLLGAASTASANQSFFKSDIFTSDDSFLTFNALSLHFVNADERNNVTPGIGWEYSPTKKLGFHVGTVRDSFNFQASYIGLNYATPRYSFLGARIRFILGVTALHKQFTPTSEPRTRIVPLPVVELKMSKRFTLNVSGSPEIDFQGQRTNPVLILQGKWNLF